MAAEDLQHGLRVGGVLVAGQQFRRPPAEAAAHPLQQQGRVVRRALADDHFQDQAVVGAQGDVVPLLATKPARLAAAVIDNRSQDPIFIPGEDDPEHPPILPLAK